VPSNESGEVIGERLPAGFERKHVSDALEYAEVCFAAAAGEPALRRGCVDNRIARGQRGENGDVQIGRVVTVGADQGEERPIDAEGMKRSRQ
jgi:hypothetical protein